jgi:hypothetical protein
MAMSVGETSIGEIEEAVPARRGRMTKADRLAHGRSARALRVHAEVRRLLWQRQDDDEASYAVVVETEERAAGSAAALDDPLPEETLYEDTGCAIAPSCLRCPLPRCIFDRPGSPGERRRRRRDHLIRALLVRGWNPTQIAARFGLSASQVRRIRAAMRAETPARPVRSRTDAA